MNHPDCVEVYRDDLESEELQVKYIMSALVVTQEALEYSCNNLKKDAAYVLHLAQEMLGRHAEELEQAMLGNRTGPRSPEEVAGA